MNYYPHIHVIVLGGGLDAGNHWKDTGTEFFFPVHALSHMFRGKYLAELKVLWQEDQLEFNGSAQKYRNHYYFKELINLCYEKEWLPHCKKTFGGAQSIIKYLGKYTHRIAISNYRLIRMDADTVTFWVKDYKNEGTWKELTISGIEFIRRFLMHVPPKRFVRIRHFGLLSSRIKQKKLALCRNLLGCRKYISAMREMKTPEMLKHLWGIDTCICKKCGGHIEKKQQRTTIRD